MSASAENVVVTRALNKRYGSTTALESLDLEVPRGAVFGLLGPNGAGKSTTFGILCGWLRASSGSAEVLGVSCRSLHKLRGRVAALPQDAHFPEQISVGDELVHFGRLMGMTGGAARREAHAALDAVGMREAEPLTGGQLSHGMLKRVGLAQALMGQPDIVFLDEPTAGLDPKSARLIKDVIAAQAPATTVVLSSHNLVDVQEICTHGAILDHGRLVAAGPIEVLTRSGAEITIELDAGASPPLDALATQFGADRITVREDCLIIGFAAEDDVSAVIASALRILLEAETRILGVSRGRSLEKTFLEMTQ